MGDEKYKGYYGKSLDVLKQNDVEVWADVEIETTRGQFKGIILPRAETFDNLHINIKLANGYNIGIETDTITSMKAHGIRKANYKIPEKEFPFDPKKPNVKLLGTGGTIASRLDYRTGAVIPAFTPGELYGSVPELADYCNLETDKLFGVFSENMGPKEWIITAQNVAKAIEDGFKGVIIGHGTDTMHYTAAAVTFMVQNLPVPVVMVGSQRSSDRPSSDAALNLIHAANTAAYSDIAETVVCMFGPTSDSYGLLHRGTRVRKMHSSYRSAFRTIGDIPVAMVDREKVTPLRSDYNKRRDDRDIKLNAVFEEKVSIVYYYPNMQPDIIDSLVDNGYKGIVIAGTGLGHVNKDVYGALRRAVKKGLSIFMTVQTLWGYTQMYVYDTGRDLLSMGLVSTENMLPEVAYVKLGWVLAQTDDKEEISRMMLTPVNGEITDREPHNGYLLYQGGIPEVEEFLKSVMK